MLTPRNISEEVWHLHNAIFSAISEKVNRLLTFCYPLAKLKYSFDTSCIIHIFALSIKICYGNWQVENT